MQLPKALRTWLAANHDVLSVDDRLIAANLAAEIERGESAHLTTDLTVEQQLTIIAMTEVGDREQVGHVFRSALHWHRFGGDQTTGVAAPPIAGALPPPVQPASDAGMAETQPIENQPAEHEPSPQLPTQPTPPRQAPRRQNSSAAGAAALMVALLLLIAFVLLLSGTDDEVARVEPVPTPTATPAFVTSPLPTPTMTPSPTATANPVGQALADPTPTPTPTATANPAGQALTDPTPTANPAGQALTDPTPTANPAAPDDQLDLGSLNETIRLRPFDGEPSAGWTLTIAPGRILDRSLTDLTLDGHEVIAFDVWLEPISGLPPIDPPLANPRLIVVGGDSEQPNLGGGFFTCPTDRGTWPQFAPEIDRAVQGLMCFIEEDADLASPRSRLLFAADGHVTVAFPLQ